MIMKFKAEVFDAGFTLVKTAVDGSPDLTLVEINDFTRMLKSKLASVIEEDQ